MNKEAKLWFDWTKVAGLWCGALAFWLFHVWSNAQGDLGIWSSLSLLGFCLTGGIALIWTLVLIVDRSLQPKDHPYQIGTTTWERDDQSFWG